MSTADMLDGLEPLLQPISTAAPAGELLRYEGTYDRIQEGRREEMDLPQGVWQREPKKADWSAVERLCTDAMTHRTKDLQIAAWLAEAWVRLEGMAGLCRGLLLVQELHQRFWESMFPEVDDLEYRVRQMEWINEKLATQIKFISIAVPVDTTILPEVTFVRWEAVQHSEQVARRYSHAQDGSKSEQALLQRSVAATPEDFYRTLGTQLEAARKICGEVDAVLDALYGEQNPGLRQVKEVLEAMAFLVMPLVKPRSTALVLEPAIEQKEAVTMEMPTATSAVSTGIRNRNDAYRCLAEVAEYLARTEPHSPVPYLIRRAIAWGDMSLDELLPELLRHEGALSDVVSLLQIDSPRR